MAKLVQIKQPLLMRVRRPGEMLANPVTKFDAPRRAFGTMRIERDPNNAIVVGYRHTATNWPEKFGEINGMPRKYLSRYTVNENNNVIIECFPIEQDRYGAAIETLVNNQNSINIDWRPDVKRYEGVRAGMYAFFEGLIGQTVPLYVAN